MTSDTHTHFCCLSSSRETLFIYIVVFLLQLPFSVRFLSSLSLFVLSCPLRFSSLFMIVPLSLLRLHTTSIRHRSWLHLDMDLHISLPLTSFASNQYIQFIAHSQTVHGNELSASLRHSQWCGRRAASLLLSVSAFVLLFMWWRESCLSLFISTWCSRELDDANKQTDIDP